VGKSPSKAPSTPEEKIKDLTGRVAELEAELSVRAKEAQSSKKQVLDLTAKVEQLMLRIGEELKMAHSLQKSLVPVEFPNIPGFEFSTKFLPSMVQGGDYFDIFELQDKFRFAIVLASATGHTISSLFLSVLMRLYSQIQAKKGLGPREVLERLSSEISAGISPNDSAHVFVGVVDRRNFEMSYCQVGTLLCHVLQVSTGELIKLQAHDEPLTAKGLKGLVEHSIALNASDQLVLASEIFVSVRDASGSQYGATRYEENLSKNLRLGAHERRNELFFQAQNFAQTKEFDRDATAVVALVKEKVLKLAK